MTDVDVQTATIQQAKLNIGSSTQETDAALGAFVAELESFGQPWGNDELGALIGLSYQGIFEVAMDCFATNLDAIDAYAENLGAAAEALDISDADAADHAQQAQANLPDLPL